MTLTGHDDSSSSSRILVIFCELMPKTLNGTVLTKNVIMTELHLLEARKRVVQTRETINVHKKEDVSDVIVVCQVSNCF